MEPSNSNALLACLLLVMLIGSALGSRHGLPERATAQIHGPNAPAEFLAVHNRARARVHVGPLKWSHKLAKEANRLVLCQRDRMECQFVDPRSIDYGMNQQWGRYTLSPREVVESWVNQRHFYNHADNSCAPRRQCGLYTQVVWKTTEELGCAQARCIDTSLTFCLYFPHGNYVGKKPY